jgi:hypothetical protein
LRSPITSRSHNTRVRRKAIGAGTETPAGDGGADLSVQ